MATNTFANYISTLRTPNTKEAYSNGLKKLFSTAYGDCTNMDTCATRYLADVKKKKRDYVADLNAIANLPLAPKTKSLYRTAVFDFLRSHGIFPSEEQLYRLRKNGQRGVHPITREETLTVDIIQKLLAHADARGRAMILMLVSSGARSHELLDLKIDDLDLESEPARFWIRTTKTGAPRLAFLSKEATEAIREYLKQRGRYIQQQNRAQRKLRRETRDDDQRLFPLCRGSISGMFRILITSAQIEKRDRMTSRRTIHPHSTRKFFVSQMKKELPPHVVELLVGHAGYMSMYNENLTEEEIANYYLKGEHLVTIAGVSAEVKESLRVMQEKLQEMETRLNAVTEAWVTAEIKLDEIQKKKPK